MSRTRRANGAGRVYIKHGSYYGRRPTSAGAHTNRRLGPVRRPGSSDGLTRSQAERRLRELMTAMAAAPMVPDPGITIARAGQAFVEQLEARGRAKSHVETVEAHLRVHLVPFFADK